MPLATFVQVPTVPARSHALQSPVQALLQQTLSAQNVLPHWLLLPQLPPSGVPQVASPLQLGVVPPHSPAGSVPTGMLVHVPTVPIRLQATQVVTQVVSQQTPSTQLPEMHSAPMPQVSPLALTHVEPPSHTWVPMHSSSGS